MLSTLVLTFTTEPCPGALRRGIGDALGPFISAGGMKMKFALGPDTLPAWASWIIVIALFLYQTLDALDGKQARRTGSSSPLGQLFDHGCDTLALLACLVNLSYALGFAGISSAIGRAIVVFGALSMFAAQWEERFTHVLRTQAGGLGVSEVQFIFMAIQASIGGLWPTFSGFYLHATSSVTAGCIGTRRLQSAACKAERFLDA